MPQNNKQMKFIDLIYFNLYRWYNKMKTDGRNVEPTGLTAMMFGICVMGWFIDFTLLYFKFILKTTYFGNSYTTFIFILVWFISYGLINNYYLSKDRYLVIYNKYLSMETNKRSSPILLSFFFITLPYIILGFYGLILWLI
jgi:hypothetical protein